MRVQLIEYKRNTERVGVSSKHKKSGSDAEAGDVRSKSEASLTRSLISHGGARGLGRLARSAEGSQLPCTGTKDICNFTKENGRLCCVLLEHLFKRYREISKQDV